MALRVAIVGLGKRFDVAYRDSLRRLVDTGLLDLVAVCDVDEGRCQGVAEEWGAERHSSLDEVLTQSEVEGIILVTPVRVKDGQARQVLEAGKHLFVESPAGTTSRNVKRLRGLAVKSDLVVEVAEDEAFWPTVRAVRKRVLDGEISDLVAVYNDCREFYYHGYARLGLLVEEDVATRYGVLSRRLVDDARVTWREVVYQSGVVYQQRFVHPRAHGLAQPRWVLAGTNGVIVDDFDGEEHAAGVEYLLKGWLGAIHGGNSVHYGLERAESDVRMWQELEIADRLSFLQTGAWLPRIGNRLVEMLRR